jgi:hypothetical protein
LGLDIINKYVPTERQATAHRAHQRYKLYGGSMGGGKSVWLCAEVIELMMQYPGNRAIMCRYTLKDFKATTLVTLKKFFTEFIGPEVLEGDSMELGHNKTDCEFRFKNGSVIKYTGLNASNKSNPIWKSSEIPSAFSYGLSPLLIGEKSHKSPR